MKGAVYVNKFMSKHNRSAAQMPEYINKTAFRQYLFPCRKHAQGMPRCWRCWCSRSTVHEASTTLLGILINVLQNMGQFQLRFCHLQSKGLIFQVVLKLIHKICSIRILTNLKHLANARPSHSESPNRTLTPILHLAAVLISNTNGRVLSFKWNRTVCILDWRLNMAFSQIQPLHKNKVPPRCRCHYRWFILAALSVPLCE